MTKAEARAIHVVLKRAYDCLNETRNAIGTMTLPEVSESIHEAASDVYLVLAMASEELG
jgi:hypothetical protein